MNYWSLDFCPSFHDKFYIHINFYIGPQEKNKSNHQKCHIFLSEIHKSSDICFERCTQKQWPMRYRTVNYRNRKKIKKRF